MSRFRNVKITNNEHKILLENLLDFQAKRNFGVKFNNLDIQTQVTILNKVKKFVEFIRKEEES